MGRLVVRYLDGDRICWGEVTGDGPTAGDDVVTVAKLSVDASTLGDFLHALPSSGSSDGDLQIPADRLLSPVTDNATIFAQGLNYQAHAEEARHGTRHSNLIFAKASSSLTGPFGDIVRPAEVELLDYEVEIGIVLRRDLGAGEEVTADTLGGAVAGVVLCNDVSARDTMFGTSFLQWFRGKSYRTFCPTGPVLWLLEPEEVSQALASLEIRLWVNGELRQQGSFGQLVYGPAETLTYIASSMDMKRGDLLLTGTPAGVTAGASPAVIEILKSHLLSDDVRRDEFRIEMAKGRPFLQPGDTVTATLVGGGGVTLGGLSNRVVAAS